MIYWRSSYCKHLRYRLLARVYPSVINNDLKNYFDFLENISDVKAKETRLLNSKTIFDMCEKRIAAEKKAGADPFYMVGAMGHYRHAIRDQKQSAEDIARALDIEDEWEGK